MVLKKKTDAIMDSYHFINYTPIVKFEGIER